VLAVDMNSRKNKEQIKILKDRNMKELKIAFSNIKKRKSSAITLVAITLIATVMLSISLSLLMGMGRLFDNRATELNAPDMSFALASGTWQSEDHQHLLDSEGLSAYMVRDAFVGSVRYELGGRMIRNEFIFTLTPEENLPLNTLYVVDRLLSRPQNHIILPLIFRSSFNSGDTLELVSAGVSYVFTIYGFYENMFFGSPGAPASMAYVSNDAFSRLYYDNNFRPVTLVCIRFNEFDQATAYWNSFIGIRPRNLAFWADLNAMRGGVTSFSMIMASILSLVAFILVLIAVIVARFSVINNIEQDVQTLGALKSIGFTSKQIIWAVVLQFVLIVLVGIILGLITALILMTPIGNMVAASSGLLWSGGSMALPIIISIFAVLGLMFFSTYLIARKTKKVTPIVALRQGLETHNFKKSATNLEKTKMPLNLSMALKQFKANFKRNITALITLTLFGFIAVLGFTLHYNFVVNTEAYRNMVAIEPAEIRINALTDEFMTDQFDNIANHENVRQALQMSNFVLGTIDGRGFMVSVWEDISRREANPIVRGRFPSADNEISLAVSFSEWLGVGIGDTIALGRQGSDITANFLVVGVTQGWGAGGDMTLEGFERIEENAILRGFYLYLYDGSPHAIESLSNELIQEFGREINIINNAENFYEFMAQMQPPIVAAMYLIIVVMIAVIALVFFLMANTIINRNRKEIGILRAMGFTSGQLMLQLFLSFLPIILGGVVLGTVLGILLTNPLASLMFSGIGIAQANFTFVPWRIIVGAVTIIASCIITLLLVSLKYKKTTAHSLISEG